MLPLTLAIVACDEEDRIERAIASVPGAAEVLVLDSGSSDDTVAVARAAGARVVETDWPGYGFQKNRALAMATQPWVLFLDADEWASESLAVSIEQVLERPGSAVGFSVCRRNRFVGQPVVGGCMGPSWKVRLVQRHAGRWEERILHETLSCDGPVQRLDGLLDHDPYRTPKEQKQTARTYAQLFSAQAILEGRRARLWDPAARSVLHFLKSILLRAGFRDGLLGVRLAWLGAQEVAWKWAALRRMQVRGAADRRATKSGTFPAIGIE